MIFKPSDKSKHRIPIGDLPNGEYIVEYLTTRSKIEKGRLGRYRYDRRASNQTA